MKFHYWLVTALVIGWSVHTLLTEAQAALQHAIQGVVK